MTRAGQVEGNGGPAVEDLPLEQRNPEAAKKHEEVKGMPKTGGCPFMSALQSRDVSGLLGLARKVMDQKSFGDASFDKAAAVLEEALRLNPSDRDGEINGLMGKVRYLQQRYGDAQRHFEVACRRAPNNADYQDLLDKATVNVETKIQQPLMPFEYFDGDKLLRPPAEFLRAPKDLAPLIKHHPSLGARLGATLKKIPAAVLGTLFESGIKGAALLGTNDEVNTNWYNKPSLLAKMSLGAMREWLNHHALTNNYEGSLVGWQQAGQKRPEWTERFRTANGAWTTSEPMEGAAGTELMHMGVDGITSRVNRAEDPELPSPREVSRVMLSAKGEQTVAPFLNNLAISWIQFQNHDWVSHGENMLDESYAIELAEDDPIRSKYGQSHMHVRKTQVNPTRADDKLAHLNEVTHWWDGSQIYGSDQKTQDRLRMSPDGSFLVGGKMRIEEDGQLPINPETGVADTGFSRNWWLGLDIFHTLFVKHHNHICDELARDHPDWSSDQTFHTARLINCATMAKIHTVEWTPAVLPNKDLTEGMGANWWGLFETWFKPMEERVARNGLDVDHPILGGLVGGETNNHGKPYALTEKFTEVYRLHPGVPNEIELRAIGSDAVTKIPTTSTRAQGAQSLVEAHGMDELINSFGHQKMTALVNNNYPKFMEELSIDGQAVVDLGAIDVLRARERGVPPYNEFRESIGLKPIRRFEDLGCDAQTVERLEGLYGQGPEGVAKLDLIVGMYTEAVRPDYFGFGETQFQVFIAMASRRLQADPFYSEKFNADYYTQRGLDMVQHANLKDILLMHYPELAKTGLAQINNAFEPWGTTAETHPEEHPLTANRAENYASSKLGLSR